MQQFFISFTVLNPHANTGDVGRAFSLLSNGEFKRDSAEGVLTAVACFCLFFSSLKVDLSVVVSRCISVGR